jgi:23S rRNA-intervening sequence protein
MAEGASVRARRLPIHRRLSPAGDLRLIPAKASGCRLDRGEYRRRFAKRSKAEKARFLNMAEGSLEESRYFLILAQDLGYGQTHDLMRLLEEASRLLNTYTRTLLASGS